MTPGRAPPYRQPAAWPHSWQSIDTTVRPSANRISTGSVSTSRSPAPTPCSANIHPSDAASPARTATITTGENSGLSTRAITPTTRSGTSVRRAVNASRGVDADDLDRRARLGGGHAQRAQLVGHQVVHVAGADGTAERLAHPGRHRGRRAAPVELAGHRVEQPGELHDLAVGPAGQEVGLREPGSLVLAEQLDTGQERGRDGAVRHGGRRRHATPVLLAHPEIPRPVAVARKRRGGASHRCRGRSARGSRVALGSRPEYPRRRSAGAAAIRPRRRARRTSAAPPGCTGWRSTARSP